jgi:hypothetical protein
MIFEWETPKQVTSGNKLTNFPLCIDDPHALMPIFHELKMNLKGIFFKKNYNCALFTLLVMQLP